MPHLPDHIAQEFIAEWTHGAAIESLALRLTCREVEALAAVLEHLGHSPAAEHWREFHAIWDLPAQDHHGGTDDHALTIALDRALKTWRHTGVHAGRLTCTLIARRLRQAHPTAATLTLESAPEPDGMLMPVSWTDTYGHTHTVEADTADRLENLTGNLLAENANAWHPLCALVEHSAGRYVLNLSHALRAADGEWGS